MYYQPHMRSTHHLRISGFITSVSHESATRTGHAPVVSPALALLYLMRPTTTHYFLPRAGLALSYESSTSSAATIYVLTSFSSRRERTDLISGSSWEAGTAIFPVRVHALS